VPVLEVRENTCRSHRADTAGSGAGVEQGWNGGRDETHTEFKIRCGGGGDSVCESRNANTLPLPL